MRIYQYVPVLRTMGIEVTVSPLLRDDYLKRQYSGESTKWVWVFSDYLNQISKLWNARKYDVLWIEKELFPNIPAWFERILSILNIPYVVDYDDAIFHSHLGRPGIINRMMGGKIDQVMRSSAMVICGNAYLAERAVLAGARQVKIIPTVIDLGRYQVIDKSNESKIIVGWVGSPSTARYLELVIPVLRILALEFPLQLRIIGAQFVAEGLDIDCRQWTEASEVSEIQGFDIGIMPLIDSPWERGKCGYKLIQYMACGKPVVASAVGANCTIVSDGMNGYLTHRTEDWSMALRALLTDASMAQRMGARGRKKVVEEYCLQVTAPQLAEWLRVSAAN